MSLFNDLNRYNDLLASIIDEIATFVTENDIKRKMDDRSREIDEILDPIAEGIRLKIWADKFDTLHTSLKPLKIDSNLSDIKSHINTALRKGSPSNQNDVEYRNSIKLLEEQVAEFEKITTVHKSQLLDFENYLKVNGLNSPNLSDIITDDYNLQDYRYVEDNVAKIIKKGKDDAGTKNFLKKLTTEEDLLYQRLSQFTIDLSSLSNIEWSTLKTLHNKLNNSEVNERLKVRMGLYSKYDLKREELPSNAISIQLKIALASENANGESLNLDDFDGIREWDIDIMHLFSIHLV
jgi:hypothetical protein